MKRTILFALVLTAWPAFAKQESWYWTFGFGPGRSFYSGSFGDAVKSVRTTDSVGLAGDLAFYWPVGDGKTVLGPAVVYSQDPLNSVGDKLTNGMVAFSAMHSFGSEPGEGFFIRGDAGFGSITLSNDFNYGSITYGHSSGFGLAGTVGYGLPVSDETRLLFQLRTQFVFGSNSAGAFVFNFGPMF